MNKELNRKLEEIAFRLQRLTDDYHDLLKEITESDTVVESKKIIYEQHKTKVNGFIINNKYSIKSKLIRPCMCLNYVSKNNRYLNETKYYYSSIDNDYLIPISLDTSLIIETYIPSKNIVLVVEL